MKRREVIFKKSRLFRWKLFLISSELESRKFAPMNYESRKWIRTSF